MNKSHDLNLSAQYKYHPPSLDVMIIRPEGVTGGHGEEDEIIPEIHWTTTPEGKFLFAEIYDWHERSEKLKAKIPQRISEVMGWEASLIQSLIQNAEQAKK